MNYDDVKYKPFSPPVIPDDKKICRYCTYFFIHEINEDLIFKCSKNKLVLDYVNRSCTSFVINPDILDSVK